VFDYLLFSMILIYVWRIQDLFPILSKIQVPILCSLAALSLFVVQGHASRALSALRTPILIVAAFILVWMVVSVPGSVYQGMSFRYIVGDHIKTFLMMVMIAASIRVFADVERLVFAFLLGAGIYCVLVLTTLEVGSNGRLGDLFYYDSNDLAMMIVCTLPYALYFLRSGAKLWQRWLALASAGIIVLAIVRTGSRGGFLALIGVVACMLIWFTAFRAKVRFGFVALSALLVFAFAGPRYWTMMGTMLNPKSDYNWSGNADDGRMAIWKRGMGYMASNPIAGVGAGAFWVAEGTISPIADRQNYGEGLKWSTAHNSFVQIGAELGMPGLIAFLLLIYRMFATAWRIGRSRVRGDRPRSENALGQATVACLVGYVIAGSFLSQAYSAYLYATCGVLTGFAIAVREPDTMRAFARRTAKARGRVSRAFHRPTPASPAS
jgi:O-antigen ligase